MDLPRVLRELYTERRCLETIIAALEIISRSPDERVGAALVAHLRNSGWDGSMLRLGQSEKRELTRLARRVCRAGMAAGDEDGSTALPRVDHGAALAAAVIPCIRSRSGIQAA
ncbi:MAG TPA: hypothetical protein VFA54_16075 [Bryobacterales bacterium]|jgi:hypothetical protein|nr:hypothetical protein [Bryobacterales bacterium]